MEKLQQKIQATLQALPDKIKIEALAFFDSSFSNQGFTDTSLTKWQERKKPDKGRKKNDSTRSILILTGALRRSIKGKVQANTITIYSNSPYLKIHNEGLPMRGGKRMPKRQFIGRSAVLKKKIFALVEKEFTKIKND